LQINNEQKIPASDFLGIDPYSQLRWQLEIAVVDLALVSGSHNDRVLKATITSRETSDRAREKRIAERKEMNVRDAPVRLPFVGLVFVPVIAVSVHQDALERLVEEVRVLRSDPGAEANEAGQEFRSNRNLLVHVNSVIHIKVRQRKVYRAPIKLKT
jgi:hypothetical protein